MLTLEYPMTTRSAEDGDEPLIAQSRAGSVEAFGALVARHRDGIFHFVRHALRVAGLNTEADAPDIAQETFVRAFAALPRFRSGAPFEPWLYAIAANLCRDHLRRVRRRSSLDQLAPPSSDGGDPARAVEERDLHQRLLHAIAALPDEQRMVLVLRHLHDRSYRDIATILSLPVSTVEHRLRSARLALREQLRDDFCMLPDTDAKGGAR